MVKCSLIETEEKEKRRKSAALFLIKYLHLGIDECFAEGSITVDKTTCKGVECRLCIEACPINALHREPETGEVRIIEELCIYCGACVLSCVVDDCIRVMRKRVTGEIESFSKPRDVVILQHNINTKKRFERTHARMRARIDGVGRKDHSIVSEV